MGVFSVRASRRPEGDAPSTWRALLPFVIAGLLAAAAVAGGGVVALRSFGEDRAIRDVEERTRIFARTVIEPRLGAALSADPQRREQFAFDIDTLVFSDNLALKRVKLWDDSGRIVYSDLEALVGQAFPLDAEKREALATGEPHSEISDLAGPENRFDRDQGSLLEVYLRARSDTGESLLFETYWDEASIRGSAGKLWRPFLPWLLGSLLVLWLIQLPIAWSMAGRLRARQREREALMTRTLDASNDERRRIAADLHDGPVQELAGLSYQLSAAAEGAGRSEADLRGSLREAAGDARTVMRKLRALLVDIHPPNLRSEGLAAAVGDLVAPMAAAGVAVTADIPQDLPLSVEVEELLFRGAQEALRNVEKHARATTARVGVTLENGTVRLRVEDNGAGFAAEAITERNGDDGHMGLRLLEELAAREGGSVRVRSTPGTGTTFDLEVPHA